MTQEQIARLSALLVSVSHRTVPLTMEMAERLLRHVIAEVGSPFAMPVGVSPSDHQPKT